MGKYSEVLKGLEKLPGEGDRQKILDDIKSGFNKDGMTATDVARYWRDLRHNVDDLEEAIKDLNLEMEAASQAIVEKFEAEGLTMLKLTEGGSVSVQEEPYAQVEDPIAFRAHCMADDDLRRQMSLPWQTTNAIVKRLLLDGEAYPPGVKAYIKPKLVLRAK